MESNLPANNPKGIRNIRSRKEDIGLLHGKVPPQAPQLEEAILGAVMLDKDALPVIIDILSPESFYREAHQKIFTAMLELFEKTLPIDMLTVTEALRKAGDLEVVGGPFYLVELTNRVASAANIEYHARLVAQKHIQRELIRVSTKTIQNAFDDTSDVFELLDQAEQGLFDITQNNLNRSYESMDTLAVKLKKELEELRNKKEGLTGVPTGFTEIDRLTSGLQRSDLIIIAARPGMGKSSLILSLARNAAADFQKGVAIFSLEMSSVQLASRLVSLEAEISGHKLRNAQLEEDEWVRLNDCLERISEVPIFIDDTPGLNIFELRAKCRRLKMQNDIQLVVIDYLQLMSGGSGNQKGNREQEVSAISRSLKALAKEINVPVIALSQLSRAVEVRGGTKRPQLSDLRESGCLTGDTLLIHAKTGEPMTIQSLAEREQQTPIPVIAMGNNFKLTSHVMTKAFSSGVKEVFELKTRTGRVIKASANHPFQKLEGWTRLDKLEVGDRIAVARDIPIPNTQSQLSQDELILIAHLLGDGCILPRQSYHYTSADTQNIEIVNQTAQSLFNINGKIVQQENWWHTYLTSPYHLTHGKKHPITIWYESLGIDRVRSYKKVIPKGVFLCSNSDIALFLRHLWATDGNISWKILKSRKRSATIYHASSSELMVRQAQHLLLRLNIKSTIRRVSQGKHRDNYHLQIQGAKNQLVFLNKVGCHGQRGNIIPEMKVALEQIESNPNYDVIPKTAWNIYVKPRMQEQGMTQTAFAAALGIAKSSATYKTGISRMRLEKINEVLHSERLNDLAKSDILWDEIISITSLGKQEVYDATVPSVSNFLANDVIVHNSIEQDADMVAFIYRPEYYDIMEDEEGHSLKGVAEIIFAKNRHGATKTINLKFIDKFAKFTDLDNFSLSDFGLEEDSPPPISDANYGNIQTIPSKMNEDEDIPF